MNLIAGKHAQLEATYLASTTEAPHDDHHATAEPPAFYSVIPFAALLLCIAFLPLIHKTEEWWEHNKNRLLVAVSLGLVTLLYYTFLYGHGVVDHGTHELSEPGIPAAIVVLKNALLVEYVPFIALLFSLYVISGGIAFNGHLVGRPALNTGIIAIGGAIASFIGTTGAAMLLIRPLLKANEKRDYVAHTVIFFIFVVCNTGGCLLPIGDPPLFLGFLRGVPFTWTLSLWPMWLAMNLALLVIYFLFDTVRYKKENKEKVEAVPETVEPFSLRGSINFLWLLLVIFCVALFDPSKPVPGTEWHAPHFFREVCMFVLAGVSLVTTSKSIREQNSFNYDAILEVAALFVGIFICMQAPVQILNVNGASLGIDSPWKFYWATGILSSFLDNAPTYVVFFETAKAAGTNGAAVAGVNEVSLVAISLGAVFMGAMTYIGNGPNFMVKAIAEKNNIRMPSFFGFMAYSCAVLLPLSVVLTFVFLL
ncbi:sodium:proton antiporter [Gimesia aquarii]|uniref:Citrate transporter n=1 Tax=Gimesia aquarii TaxID=2527964 RepID=A0A517W3L5_9PLAN|nr:sodium:proton antiporter [Gimesia aquarii]QDT99849.1 hypothetical protein V144x_53620 [Gimesia aquarii]